MLAGHATSVALEPEFWAALEARARAEGISLAALIAIGAAVLLFLALRALRSMTCRLFERAVGGQPVQPALWCLSSLPMRGWVRWCCQRCRLPWW